MNSTQGRNAMSDHKHFNQGRGGEGEEKDTYSALKPLTCKIRICLTMVLFPDSPAPVEEKREKKKGRGSEREQLDQSRHSFYSL